MTRQPEQGRGRVLATIRGASAWNLPPWFTGLASVSWRFVVIVAAGAVIVAVIAACSVVIVPVFLALLLAGALSPLDGWLRGHGWAPALAAAATTLLLLAALVACVWLVLDLVVDQWVSISADIDAGIANLSETASDTAGVDNAEVDSIVNDLRDFLGDVTELLVRGLIAVVPAAVSVLSTILLALLVLFFLLKDGAHIWNWTVETVGGSQQGTLDNVGRASFKALANYMRAQAAIAAIDASLISIGALLLGVPHAGAILLLTFFGAFIPYVGALIVGGLAVLLAAAEGGTSLAFWMLLIVVAVQLIEGNLLQPLIQSHSMQLHPLVVALAMVLGGALGGFLGMLVAVPLTGAAVSAVTELRNAGFFAAGETVRGSS